MALTLSKKAQEVKPSSTLAITAKAKELISSGIDVIGFAAGEPDFDTPENICDAAIKAIQEGFTRYTPAEGTLELRMAASDKFLSFNNVKYEPSQIVVSNGGKHSLTNVFEALLNPGDEVLIPVPYWLSYPEIVKLADGVPVFVEGEKSRQYKVTAEQIKEACTEKTKALILNTPSNPSGMIYNKEELLEIAQVAIEKEFYIISDEMYENLVYEGEAISIASLNEEIYNRTITCSGVAKSYAMTGWRIGFTAAPEPIAKLMAGIQSHQTSNPNSIAQKAAYEALVGPQDSVYKMHEEFKKRRDYMYERVCDMKYLSCMKPQGAFYLFIDVNEVLNKQYQGHEINDVNVISKILLDEFNVAVIPCADFGCADHIRLSYAISMEQIKKGLDRMEEFLDQLI